MIYSSRPPALQKVMPACGKQCRKCNTLQNIVEAPALLMQLNRRNIQILEIVKFYCALGVLPVKQRL